MSKIKTKITGTVCALCRESPNLCDSHIIPEFFYKPTYDGGKRGRAKELTRKTGRWRAMQKGHREPLLCTKCEQFLNLEYENYVKEVWYDEGKLPDPVTTDLVVLEGLDYRRFKLCMLSILWRASVSQLSMFGQVSLGPHEDTIRGMLRAGTAGGEDEYVFATQVLVMNGKVVHGTVMEPVQVRHNGHRVYVFIFEGCAWNFFVGAHPPAAFAELGIRQSGALPVMRQEFTKLDFIRDFVIDYLRAKSDR